MAILNQFGLKKPIRATLSNPNFWFKIDHTRSGLTQQWDDPKTTTYAQNSTYNKICKPILKKFLVVTNRKINFQSCLNRYPDYHASLSKASQGTLINQGGPMIGTIHK